MKRFLALMLVLSLILGICTSAIAAEVESKLSSSDYRISAYTVYLKELFYDGGKGRITYVGVADVNRDYRPELFYIYKEPGNVCTFHFCGFEDEEVFEYDIEENYIGISPTSLSLKRYNRIGTSEHIWILQSTGKNKDKRNEKLVNVFTRCGNALDNELKLQRTWTGKGSKIIYTVEGQETIKSVYEAKLDELLSTKHKPAAKTSFKNEGTIRKVSSPKTWLGVRNALSTAAVKWKALLPITL